MNSDEDRDVDIESDEDDDGEGGSNISTQFMTQAERRAHHNALERKRRDHIKESFHGLRDCVPSMQGDKASRAQILKQATDYIQFMSKKNGGHQKDIDDLKKQNTLLESQITKQNKKTTHQTVRGLERAKATGAFAAQSALDGGGPSKSGAQSTNYHDEESGEESSDTESTGQSRRKKIKTSTK